MVSDETAYRKYLAGDEAAAQLLVERYGDALTLYISGVLGDIHEAEDLMIEAFAHIFAKERPIQDGCFKAYLYKTGRNLALRCKTRRRFFLPLEMCIRDRVNIVRCRNPRCISSIEEECDQIFEMSSNGKYRCIYCEQELQVKPE